MCMCVGVIYLCAIHDSVYLRSHTSLTFQSFVRHQAKHDTLDKDPFSVPSSGLASAAHDPFASVGESDSHMQDVKSAFQNWGIDGDSSNGTSSSSSSSSDSEPSAFSDNGGFESHRRTRTRASTRVRRADSSSDGDSSGDTDTSSAEDLQTNIFGNRGGRLSSKEIDMSSTLQLGLTQQDTQSVQTNADAMDDMFDIFYSPPQDG
jgi:hypothetical protein